MILVQNEIESQLKDKTIYHIVNIQDNRMQLILYLKNNHSVNILNLLANLMKECSLKVESCEVSTHYGNNKLYNYWLVLNEEPG